MNETRPALQLQAAAERLHQHGLGQPGHAFEQDVAAAQHRQDDLFERGALADDRLGQLIEQTLARGGQAGDQLGLGGIGRERWTCHDYRAPRLSG